MLNKKLVNVGKETAFSDAIAKTNLIQLWVINTIMTRILILRILIM